MMTVVAPHAPLETNFFKPSVSDFAAIARSMCLGPGAPSAALQEGEQAALCLMVLPLPKGCLAPSEQIFQATIGSRDFCAVAQEHCQKAAIEMKAAAQWIDTRAMLPRWLNTVASHAEHFTTPFVTEASTRDSFEMTAAVQEELWALGHGSEQLLLGACNVMLLEPQQPWRGLSYTRFLRSTWRPASRVLQRLGLGFLILT